MLLLCVAGVPHDLAREANGSEATLPTLAGKPEFHQTTDWRALPSFKFDTLCFLNALTGDPFYVKYYKGEYARFQPQLTPAARNALANLKRRIKHDNKGIISAFLCSYFSATNDETLDDLLKTLDDTGAMQNVLRQTPYYSEVGWREFKAAGADLKTVFLFLKDIRFEDYWRENVLPKVRLKIAAMEKELPKYNVVAEVEKHLGYALPSNQITVYMLYYSQPHGIRITGTRFLTDIAWPLPILVRNAIHEMMHPPYDWQRDGELRKIVAALKADAFLMDKVKNHNPDFGYNSFESYIEENCIRALDQIISERLGIALEPRKRWRYEDDGMHVFAVALYSLLKQENYNARAEKFRDFLIRMIRSDKLAAGKIQSSYESFYAQQVTL